MRLMDNPFATRSCDGRPTRCFATSSALVVFKIVHLKNASSVMGFTCKKRTNEKKFIKLPLFPIFQRKCMFYMYFLKIISSVNQPQLVC